MSASSSRTPASMRSCLSAPGGGRANSCSSTTRPPTCALPKRSACRRSTLALASTWRRSSWPAAPCPEEAGKKPAASVILHVETALVGGGGGALLLTRWGDAVTTETRKLAAILAADVVGFSRRRRRGAYARAAESAACRILQARLLRRPLSREDGGRIL